MLTTISSSLLAEQCSAPTQQYPQISTASAIRIGPTQHRMGQHHCESGWIRSIRSQLYLFCKSTRITTQRLLSLQLHAAHAGGGGADITAF